MIFADKLNVNLFCLCPFLVNNVFRIVITDSESASVSEAGYSVMHTTSFVTCEKVCSFLTKKIIHPKQYNRKRPKGTAEVATLFGFSRTSWRKSLHFSAPAEHSGESRYTLRRKPKEKKETASLFGGNPTIWRESPAFSVAVED